ncbi:hypothetical protein [Solimicrobium silvestre]|uniref:Uncharacterized protein n=1 Tax=Solimicrobium silvestre TaxID=2099400 RepID=A0A2S9GY34_9BURK|nr:hypothetical protein [Solimicrobium silvestre]PRC92618.1 hypothetical protein S2091_2673 [Solimicrobium silvestre]
MNNQYGLDVGYFKTKLSQIIRDVESYTSDEMFRDLTKYAEVVRPVETVKHTGPVAYAPFWIKESGFRATGISAISDTTFTVPLYTCPISNEDVVDVIKKFNSFASSFNDGDSIAQQVRQFNEVQAAINLIESRMA